MFSKDIAFTIVSDLVTRFDEQIASYKKADYNETQVRRDFIDPFFRALGWDVDNSQGYAEAYREVIHEDRVKVSGATKAPDYSFRLPGGKRLFFVEAKKPSVAVKTDTLPAYQVRRYAWSAKLPVSLLTDFEEFAVYDCNKKPSEADKASTGRIKYLTYKEYLSEFDFLWDTFSKERVLKGSFDKYIAGDAGKKGTTTVDKEFLASLDEWRMLLAQNIALRNGTFTEDDLNFAVQQTIDRIIFLRIAEDRGVEEYGLLKKCVSGVSTGNEGLYYQNLFHYFKEADSKYNSGLFDFKKDKLSAALQVDNKVLKAIIGQLYYPVSPYEFSVLSVEILGSAYEQFLGKQIKLDARHKVVIDEKPEVRKAGGVYYTPQYIVDYIVEQTVGIKVPMNPPEAGKLKTVTPDDVAKLKIVDPACGSGSFLIGAYDYLMKWHLNYYKPTFIALSEIAGNSSKPTKERNDAIKERSKLPLTPDGNLNSHIKKQILLNNIYGVDIDTQAVEVTKLSLLLKCMEGETSSSINAEMRFGERILPTLDSNIKSGNSLVDLDYYDGEIDFEPGADKKVKPFSWQQAFPAVFKQGGLSDSASAKSGFDCVIGNPPYVRQELLGTQKPYFQKKYKVYHGMADLYSYFFEKGIGLLKPDGLFGIIVANKWLRANYGEPLRRWMKEQDIKSIIDFGDLPVFQNATTYPCIVIASRKNENSAHNFYTTNVKTLAFESLDKYVTTSRRQLSVISLDNEGWNLGNEDEQILLKKLYNRGIPLGEYVKGKIYRGVLTGLNEAFVIDEQTKDRLIKEDSRSADIIKSFLGGRDIKRYQPPMGDKFLIFCKRGIEIDKYPAIKNYLLQFKPQLTPRPKDWKGEWLGRKPGSYSWFEIQDAIDYYLEFEKEKIILPDIALRMQASFDTNNFFCVNTAYIIPTNDKVLLGILNSNLIQFFYTKISSSIRGGYLRFIRQYLEIIPIREGEPKLKAEIVKQVETILDLNKQKQQTAHPEKLEQLQQRIQYTDDKINQLVYELYELTEEEIKMVEGN